MDLLATFVAYVDLLWPVLVVGILVFAAWGAGKEAAKRAGRHLGVAGVGLAAALLALLSLWIGQGAIALLLGLVGLVLLFAGLSGRSS